MASENAKYFGVLGVVGVCLFGLGYLVGNSREEVPATADAAAATPRYEIEAVRGSPEEANYQALLKAGKVNDLTAKGVSLYCVNERKSDERVLGELEQRSLVPGTPEDLFSYMGQSSDIVIKRFVYSLSVLWQRGDTKKDAWPSLLDSVRYKGSDPYRLIIISERPAYLDPGDCVVVRAKAGAQPVEQ